MPTTSPDSAQHGTAAAPQLLVISKPTRLQRAQLLRIYRLLQEVAGNSDWEDEHGCPLSPSAATALAFTDEAAESAEQRGHVVIAREDLAGLVKAAQSFCSTRSPWGESDVNEAAFERADKAIQAGYGALDR